MTIRISLPDTPGSSPGAANACSWITTLKYSEPSPVRCPGSTALAQARHDGAFTPAHDAFCTRLVNELVRRRMRRSWPRPSPGTDGWICFVDELGYMEQDKRGAELLFQVLTEREEKAFVAIATNESFSGWTKTFTDPRLCAAIVDRIQGVTAVPGGNPGIGTLVQMGMTRTRSRAASRAAAAAPSSCARCRCSARRPAAASRSGQAGPVRRRRRVGKVRGSGE